MDLTSAIFYMGIGDTAYAWLDCSADVFYHDVVTIVNPCLQMLLYIT